MLINDTKYISCGRIIKESSSEINKDVLKDIQMQAFGFQYPEIYNQFIDQNTKFAKLSNDYTNKKNEIINLKNEVNRLKQKMENRLTILKKCDI